MWLKKLSSGKHLARRTSSTSSHLEMIVPSATTDGEDHTTEQDPSTLLFVHQSAWQRRLLKRYGNICLLDATYKTTRYALPLFFLVVCTNGDYQVVGSFVVQFRQHSDKNQTGLSCH